jgi:hypothetical protein
MGHGFCIFFSLQVEGAGNTSSLDPLQCSGLCAGIFYASFCVLLRNEGKEDAEVHCFGSFGLIKLADFSV